MFYMQLAHKFKAVSEKNKSGKDQTLNLVF